MNVPVKDGILTRSSVADEPSWTDPLWYKDAIIYQQHVKSFSANNGDGIGDFPGLIFKLDHVTDLGVVTLWWLPFYPSPRKDAGYGISAHREVHPDYGTLTDFRHFVGKLQHIRLDPADLPFAL